MILSNKGKRQSIYNSRFKGNDGFVASIQNAIHLPHYLAPSRKLTARNSSKCDCLPSGGIRYSNKPIYDIKKKLLDKQRIGEHEWIKYLTSIDNQIRHTRSLPNCH